MKCREAINIFIITLIKTLYLILTLPQHLLHLCHILLSSFLSQFSSHLLLFQPRRHLQHPQLIPLLLLHHQIPVPDEEPLDIW